MTNIHIKARKTEGYFPKSVTKDQSKDTGMALVLICLLLGYFGIVQSLSGLAIVILLINMTIPNIYRPIARLWLGLSNILGTIVSKIVLTIMFFLIVTPIGFIRRISGFDSLQLREWKNGNTSVFNVRNHTFQPEDIEHPY